MLVLSRKDNERVLIGDNIIITVVRSRKGSVRIGFEVPPGTNILRENAVEKTLKGRIRKLKATNERPINGAM